MLQIAVTVLRIYYYFCETHKVNGTEKTHVERIHIANNMYIAKTLFTSDNKKHLYPLNSKE